MLSLSPIWTNHFIHATSWLWNIHVKKETWPAAFAGADEAVVDLFLSERIKFTDMPRALEDAMARYVPVLSPSLEDFQEAASSVKLEVLSRNGGMIT